MAAISCIVIIKYVLICRQSKYGIAIMDYYFPSLCILSAVSLSCWCQCHKIDI
jgi:hypothetical protein